jgi:hypothetical protein
MFPGVDASRPELTIEVRCTERPMIIRSSEGCVTVEPGQATAPDVVLTGPPDAAVGLLAGRIDLTEAKARGLAVTGDAGLLLDLHPQVPHRPASASRTPARSA